jgi:hypothetical protein
VAAKARWAKAKVQGMKASRRPRLPNRHAESRPKWKL